MMFKKILDTCPLTNLTGERLFGDLDYDMHKQRRASLHLRSTVTMFKHNDTINWFLSLDGKSQKEILQATEKNCQNLIKQSRNDEAHVDNKINEKMEK